MFLPIGYYNGSYLQLEDISISPLDLGVQRGYSIFDFLKIRDGHNPWMDLYLKRLYQSATDVNIKISECRSDWKTIVETLLEKNDVRDAYLKIIISAGNSLDGYQQEEKSKTLVLGSSFELPPANIYESGARLTLKEYRRDVPTVKTTNYLFSASLAKTMKEDGVIDILYHHDGLITECSRCNFFIVQGEKIKTAGKGILRGITRERVLTLQDPSVAVMEADILVEELGQATEAFITSTTKGVVPITHIDDTPILDGQVGPVTRELMSRINVF